MIISSSKSCPHCGDNHRGKPFTLYEDGYHCFSCGSSKRAIRNFTLRGLVADTDVELPELTLNPSLFSLPTLKWLRSYHVTDEIIYKYHIAEAVDNSVITPVLDKVTGKVVMYQRRWRCPHCSLLKCNCGIPKRVLTYGGKKTFIASNKDDCKTIVIVEDFISAIRVGEITDCCCMFGTSLSYNVLELLVKRYDIIIIWADGDGPGQKAAKKLSETLNKLISLEIRVRAFAYPFNKVVSNLVTKLDPKCYTNTEIRAIIKDNHKVFHETNAEKYR